MSVDVVGLRALAEKALAELGKHIHAHRWDGLHHDETVAAWNVSEADRYERYAAVIREVPALLDEITTLRAEVADRDARIKAAKKLRPWLIEKADDLLSRIKTDTTEDVMLYHDAVSVLVTMRTLLNVMAGLAVPVPQDNPESIRVVKIAGQPTAADSGMVPEAHLRGRWSNGDPVHIVTDGVDRWVAPNRNGATWMLEES